MEPPNAPTEIYHQLSPSTRLARQREAQACYRVYGVPQRPHGVGFPAFGKHAIFAAPGSRGCPRRACQPVGAEHGLRGGGVGHLSDGESYGGNARLPSRQMAVLCSRGTYMSNYGKTLSCQLLAEGLHDLTGQVSSRYTRRR